jgi:hypothetical protein
MGAGIVGGLAGLLVFVGVAIQVIAMRKLKAAAQDQLK